MLPSKKKKPKYQCSSIDTSNLVFVDDCAWCEKSIPKFRHDVLCAGPRESVAPALISLKLLVQNPVHARERNVDNGAGRGGRSTSREVNGSMAADEVDLLSRVRCVFSAISLIGSSGRRFDQERIRLWWRHHDRTRRENGRTHRGS